MALYGTGLDAYPSEVFARCGGRRLHQQTFRTAPGEPDDMLLITELLYKFKAECGDLNYDDYVGGRTLLFDRESGDTFFARCYAALLEEDLTIMEAFYQYDHLRFFMYLERNWQSVLDSMERHELPGGLTLSEPVREMLLEIPVSEARIRAIRQACDRAFRGSLSDCGRGLG